MAELTHEFFAARAKSARKVAEQATDPAAQSIHERAAENYEELAKMSPPTPSLRSVED